MTRYSLLQMGGFVLMVLGTCMYYKVLRVPCLFDYSKDDAAQQKR